jgi:hypothetical protein
MHTLDISIEELQRLISEKISAIQSARDAEAARIVDEKKAREALEATRRERRAMAAAAALDRSQAVEELAKLRVEAGQLSQEVEDHRLIMTAKSDSGKQQEYCNEFIRPRVSRLEVVRKKISALEAGRRGSGSGRKRANCEHSNVRSTCKECIAISYNDQTKREAGPRRRRGEPGANRGPGAAARGDARSPGDRGRRRAEASVRALRGRAAGPAGPVLLEVAASAGRDHPGAALSAGCGQQPFPREGEGGGTGGAALYAALVHHVPRCLLSSSPIWTGATERTAKRWS